ncbi:hypothetical protein MCOR27_001554 [Pyricularia oryzae]|uniref:Uncharacterized protein n=1 Tax=Pyricularia grisea TaxID=148305 RepID=A0ABQ8NA02_PYRGI|nr:hypothetical protein MCOR01_008750 [Pyricularia oryzae]KAI6293700.1 hypothetical protein MCOR33_008935 [Pyricularia grisea]KAH9439417.1 hypothetical protein MCOR02_002972 [Pyricularia oryzae]KAI6287109.1 hypothetical protein MCOR27_001554 [Pyricularia oryzae]KAI6409558.1 hypothetical protein MCOR20_004967 [Pyricularia oryzae]
MASASRPANPEPQSAICGTGTAAIYIVLPTLSAPTGSSRLCPGARVAGSRFIVARHQHPPATSTAAYSFRGVVEFQSWPLGFDDAATPTCMAGGGKPLDVNKEMEQLSIAFKASNGFHRLTSVPTSQMKPIVHHMQHEPTTPCLFTGRIRAPDQLLRAQQSAGSASDNVRASSILTNTAVSTGVASTQAWTADACAAANE